jgi:hypothetical protein
VTSPVLALLKDKGHFQLEMDAPGVVTGAVLSQEQEDGTYHHIGYASRALNGVERN